MFAGACVSVCLSVCLCLYACMSVCVGRDDDFERTKKTDFKGEYQGVKEEPVVRVCCPVCFFSDVCCYCSH